MKVHTNRRWLAVFGPFGGGLALTLNPHIFFRGEATPELLAHEKVHLEQQQRMGLVKFLVVYLWEWCKLREKPISDHPLERPAYEAQWAVERGAL